MKKKVINIFINTGSYQSFIEHVMILSKNVSSSYVCVANVHMAIEAHQDNNFCSVVNNADLVTPDGMPLAKAITLLYGIDQDRVAGMDLLPDLMRVCEQKNLSIYLYGSTNEVLEKMTVKANMEFPTLQLYRYSPPFKTLTMEEKNAIIEEINSKNPDYVFVALGCPKQEKWMAEHKGKINSCMIGLGGAFEVYAEVKDRAPKWMQDNSLEWLYRLAQDPKRLWKRYFITNNMFIWLLMKQLIRNYISKK